MAITNTSGDSGQQTLRLLNGPVTLVTTPANIGGLTNCFFIVYLSYTSASGQISEKSKIIVGPSTDVIVQDDVLNPYYDVVWHYVGMVIA